jgi:Leucine-rich repeat (LRR) protein
MKQLAVLFCILVFSYQNQAQETLLDSVALALYAEYTDLEEAAKNPDQVIKLSLRKKGYKEFPKVILTFKNLQYLDLSKNRLKELPDSIVQLQQLQFLIVSKNELLALPNNIGKLTRLKHLNANQNQIGRIPYSFGELQHIEYIDMWDNELDYFPESLSNIKTLKEMDLRNILISQENQDYIESLLPNTKIHFSPPCKCAW